MNIRVATVVALFIASSIIGYNLVSPTVIVQAAEPVVPTILEMPSFPRVVEKKSVDEINVEVDLSTLEVSVTGTADAKVNVKTTGTPQPVVKWKTKVIEKKVSDGYPYVKSIGHTPQDAEPISPLEMIQE